jgi:hypothetical protein
MVQSFLEGPCRLLYVSGPPGVGKTALLRELERIARGRERRVRWLDAAELAPTPTGVTAAFGASADLLVLDEFDRLAPLHGWLRETLLPQLPTATQVAVAGRSAPDRTWLDESGWRSLVRPIALRNLRRSAAIEYLERRGATRDRAEKLARLAHGHPLCLSVLGDLVDRDDPASDGDAEATIEATIRRVLVENTPPERLRVLEAAAVPAVITEPLLDAMLEGTLREELKWLASRPFVDATNRGLRLHDTAARAIVAELRWRDPDRLRALRRIAARYYADRVKHVAIAQGALENSLLDVLHVLRDEPAARFLISSEAGQYYADVPTGAEVGRFVSLVEQFEGDAAGRVARAWMDSPQGELHVLRDRRGRPVGFMMYVDLPCSAAGFDDPIVHSFAAALANVGPLRDGERATLCRWFFSIEQYQVPDDVQTQMFVHMSGRLGFSPGVALGASVHRDPDVWLQRPDRTHELLARVEAWGREYGVFGTDWRREPVWAWVERVVAKLSGMGMGVAPRPEVVLLERAAFAREVKRVLRHFHDPDVLRVSPLTWAPLVRRRLVAIRPEQSAEALRETIVETCERLGREGGQPEAAALLRLAFLDQPRRKQLAIADELAMGFSTYRRHVATAVQLLTQALWADELAAG